MNEPTLRQLRYLVALCDLRNFTRAAETCCVSQPTLSGGIQDLESLLGLGLFERTKKKVIPTPEALELAERARHIVNETTAFCEASEEFADKGVAIIKMGLIPTISPFLLPWILPLLRKEFPHTDFILHEQQTSRLLKLLADGELEIFVQALPYDCPETDQYVFMDDPFWLAVPPNHALASQKEVSPADFDLREALFLEEGHCLRDHALTACNSKDFDDSAANSIQGSSLHTLLEMVAAGMGVTLVPDMAVSNAAFGGVGVKFLPMTKDTPSRQIGLIWRKNSGRADLYRQIGQVLEQRLSAGVTNAAPPLPLTTDTKLEGEIRRCLARIASREHPPSCVDPSGSSCFPDGEK